MQRMLLIITIFCSAAIFDLIHEVSPDEEKSEKSGTTANSHYIQAFYFNQANITIKGTERFFQKLLFSISENEFLERYHNFRNRHVVKAEELVTKPSFLNLSHFMKYTICHKSTDEDYLLSLFFV